MVMLFIIWGLLLLVAFWLSPIYLFWRWAESDREARRASALLVSGGRVRFSGRVSRRRMRR